MPFTVPVSASENDDVETPLTLSRPSENTTMNWSLLALFGLLATVSIDVTDGGVCSIVYVSPVKPPLIAFPAASDTPLPELFKSSPSVPSPVTLLTVTV